MQLEFNVPLLPWAAHELLMKLTAFSASVFISVNLVIICCFRLRSLDSCACSTWICGRVGVCVNVWGSNVYFVLHCLCMYLYTYHTCTSVVCTLLDYNTQHPQSQNHFRLHMHTRKHIHVHAYTRTHVRTHTDARTHARTHTHFNYCSTSLSTLTHYSVVIYVHLAYQAEQALFLLNLHVSTTHM